MSVNDETWDKCRFCKQTIKTYHGDYHDDGGCQKYDSWHKYNRRFSDEVVEKYDLAPDTLSSFSDVRDGIKAVVDAQPPVSLSQALYQTKRLSTIRDPDKVEKLIQAALKMPRGTPAPGGCGTEHQYTLRAYQVWELDAVLIALGFPYVKDNHVE